MKLINKLLALLLVYNLYSCDLILPKGDKSPFSLALLGLLQDNTINRPDLLITKDGTAINSGSIYSLPETTIASTSVLNFVVKNDGNQRLTIKSLEFKESTASVYITKYISKAILEPSESDSFEISFSPSSYGTHYGMLILDTNDERKKDFTITFSGSLLSPTAPIGAVTNITHTVNPDSSVDLFWDAVSNSASYIIMRSASSSGPYANMGETTSLSFSVLGSDPGSTWYYKIRGKSNTATIGEASTEHTVFIPAGFFPNAGQPTNFNASVYSVNNIPLQILLTWDASINADYYRIYWSNTSTISQNISNLLGQPITNSFVYTLSASDLGKTYYYQVYPYNSISSQGTPSTIISSVIPASLQRYDNVSYEIPSSWSGVTYEYKNGYSGVQYQTWADYGYSTVSWQYLAVGSQSNIGVTAVCSFNTGNNCNQFDPPAAFCPPNPCSGSASPQITVNVCTPVGGNVDINCWESASINNVYYSDIVSYSGNVSFATSGTWSGWGCAGVSNAICNPGTLSQAVVDGYLADNANYNVISSSQIWTFANPGTATLVQFSNFQAQQTVGNYRNLTGNQVWVSTSVGTKTIAEYQTLQIQQFFGQIRNLTGLPIYN